MTKPVIVRGTRLHRGLRIVGFLAVAGAAVGIPYRFDAYRVFQFTTVMYLAVAILGLNLLTGYSGQISLGHSAFYALGAYTSAILIARHNTNYLLTVPAAAALAFVVGLLFGIPALRLRGLYLALATLGLAVVTGPFIKRYDGLTGGSTGISTSPVSAPSWTGLSQDQWLYFVVLAFTVVMFVVARNLTRGRIGRGLIAVRDNEIVAETMGVNIALYKTLAFAYSAMFAGVAGALFVIVTTNAAPDSFTVVVAVSFLAAMVVGGLATISGAILGALFITFVPVYAGDINQSLQGVIYGVALVAFMLVMPGGAVSFIRRMRDRVVRIEGSRAATGAPIQEPELVTIVGTAVASTSAAVPEAGP
jgi:branched-chain amino acid transport system permease protein